MSIRGQLTGGAVAVICALSLACGDDNNGNPGGPSGGGGNCNTIGPLGDARGRVTANVGGSNFVGGVSPGNSVYLPATVPPVPAIFTAAAVCANGSQIVIAAPAVAGQTDIGVDANGNPLIDPTTQQPRLHSITYIQVVNGVAAGGWSTNLAGGSGVFTINTVSPSGASGSFALTMVPGAGTGAVGNRSMTGNFNITF